MGLGKVNYLKSGSIDYDKGFEDGLKSNVMVGHREALARAGLNDAYNLINRIRKLSKENNLSDWQREQRMIQIFNASQEFLLQKGMI